MLVVLINWCVIDGLLVGISILYVIGSEGYGVVWVVWRWCGRYDVGNIWYWWDGSIIGSDVDGEVVYVIIEVIYNEEISCFNGKFGYIKWCRCIGVDLIRVLWDEVKRWVIGSILNFDL